MQLPLTTKPEDAKTLKQMCFPNTHMEVSFEDGKYHVFSEGEWQTCTITIEGAIREVSDRLKGSVSITNGENDEWDEAPPRLYPNWAKWPMVKQQ